MDKAVKCPLDSEKFGVIPETDHLTGQCICFMCTCNKHLCPSTRPKHSARGTFVTHYKRSFPKHQSGPSPARVHAEYRPRSAKMDLVSTSQADYVTPSPQKVTQKVDRPGSSLAYHPKFTSRSTYCAEYLDWGAIPGEHTKRNLLPNHCTNMKFRSKSSYQRDFSRKTPASKPPTFRVKDPYRETKPAVAIQSTCQREFRPYEGVQTFKVRARPQSYTPTKFTPTQFLTETQRNFTGAAAEVADHHQLARSRRCRA